MRFLLPLLLLAACTSAPPLARAPAGPSLPEVFDCLRENGLALVSAHRGQADPSRAENALQSFAEVAAAGPILIELDIRKTADGALVLLHDDRLERTTTGFGPIAERTLAQLQKLRVKDGTQSPIAESPPTLQQALDWARTGGVLMQLDVKRGVPFAEVVAAVRQAGMAGQVVVITYNLADTQLMLALAPEMMVSASGRTPFETETLLRLAADNPRLLGFTGISDPDEALLARMAAARMEAITGTLGRPGDRLDDIFLADGDGSEYAALAARGVALIASDRPVEAWAALGANGRDGRRCLTGARP